MFACLSSCVLYAYAVDVQLPVFDDELQLRVTDLEDGLLLRCALMRLYDLPPLRRYEP